MAQFDPTCPDANPTDVAATYDAVNNQITARFGICDKVNANQPTTLGASLFFEGVEVPGTCVAVTHGEDRIIGFDPGRNGEVRTRGYDTPNCDDEQVFSGLSPNAAIVTLSEPMTPPLVLPQP